MTITGVVPKATKGVLEPTANTIAVENDLMFDYYTIKLGEKKGPYVELIKIPPKIIEGFVTVGKKLYKVGFKDYIRRRVNVSIEYTPNAAASSTTTSPMAETISPVVQQPISECVEVVLDQAANLAWKEQVESLLYVDDSEAQWDF